MKPPELLAPAGSPASLIAAADAGAGAVYLGWGDWNARRGARNFSDSDFAAAVADCRLRGVRVFLTLNILLTDRELPQALEAARTASRLGVDAVLVQDWGLFALLRQTLPDLPLHASTQMSVFTSGAAAFLARQGCERIVLARECSASETAAVCQSCPAEVEVFVHGALCMCYSGQCAMSALVGGRSGNRGRCAQPCRLPYGVDRPAKHRYPLSLKDNCLASHLQELSQMGAACLKIEGRMRRPAYVSAVTGIYARLLAEGRAPSSQELEALDRAFSRSGLTDGYWTGTLGTAMFGTRRDTPPSDWTPPPRRTAPVRFACRVRAGEPVQLTVSDGEGRQAAVTGPVPEPARTRPLTGEDLAARLGKTGGTPYRCEHVEASVEPGLSLSAAALNGLRREALEALSRLRTAPPARREQPPLPLPDSDCSAESPAFTVSVASPRQLTEELLAFGPARVYVPLETLDGLESLPKGPSSWCAVLPRVWRDQDEPDLRRRLQTARDRLGISGALAGNIGHLPLLEHSGLAVYGDYGLNVFNSHSLSWLREQGLASACLSFELRFSQIRDLRKTLPAEAIVYGRLPLMITEHCLVKNAGGCPCGPDRPHRLVDRTGAAFPLLPAFGCRTEIQNSRPLWLADQGGQYRSLGLAFARLRFTTESAAECVRIYRSYLQGDPAPGPFTRGLFHRGVE